jgi:hypothetical protein
MEGQVTRSRHGSRRRARRPHKSQARRLRYLRVQARRLGRRVGRRPTTRAQPWWTEAPEELSLLERDIPREYLHFKRSVVGRSIVYSGEVNLDPLPHRRRIALVFPGRPSTARPVVMADGPRTPRHRFTSYRPMPLCLWYSDDAPKMRWQLHDGLAILIDIARIHLVREARFRQTGRWRGPEVHLEDGDVPTNRALRRALGRTGGRVRCWCGTGRRYIRCHGEIAPEWELSLLGLQDQSGHGRSARAA